LNRMELGRVTPESVGISSHTITQLIDALEQTGTEMHGLMIIRHGKVAAEGWWTPYSPGMVHSLHSLTKTYAATAVCLAVDEGLVKLEDRLVDLFPEDAPSEVSENLSLLTVRDVLCMGCGMETMPPPSDNWIRDFMHTPVVHKPGTAFMYNSVGSHMLGAIVRKVSGEGLHAFLKTRLFDKIGIDSERFLWLCLPDGLEAGGGGGFATTEDNARLMMLYLQNGLWNGERVLSEEMVEVATSLQIDCSTNTEGITDCQLGYGFQIWMCRPEGVYRADGALGQYSIVFPELDMIVSINECANYPDVVQEVLDVVYDVLLPEVVSEALPEDAVAHQNLQRRLRSLSLASPTYSPYSPFVQQISGKRYEVIEGELPLFADYGWMTGDKLENIRAFSFDIDSNSCVMELEIGDSSAQVNVGIDGNGCLNQLKIAKPLSKVYIAGWWETDSCFSMEVRWLETCIVKLIKIVFLENEATVITLNRSNGLFEEKPVAARALVRD
jgi:CubicO group peptidase (beta-lactamase class C family)